MPCLFTGTKTVDGLTASAVKIRDGDANLCFWVVANVYQCPVNNPSIVVAYVSKSN